MEEVVLNADVRFIINRFVAGLEDRYDVNNVLGNEFNSVELDLGGGKFFCLNLEGDESAVMLFLFRLPVVITETELQVINGVLDAQWDGSIGSVRQMENRELIYFSVIEREGLYADSLLVLLERMLVVKKRLMTCVDNIVL